MLIKSQDGKQIINLNNCIKIVITNDNSITVYYPFADGWSKIGSYSSTEKAQKVLDWILDCHVMNRLLEVTPETIPRDLFDEYVADQNFDVYQMPSDEEVEE